MKNYRSLTLYFSIILLVIVISVMCKPKEVETQDQFDQINNPMLIALDSIAENYIMEGWSCDAAYIIAGFEVDLYDPISDTAEYRLYKAYMED